MYVMMQSQNIICSVTSMKNSKNNGAIILIILAEELIVINQYDPNTLVHIV